MDIYLLGKIENSIDLVVAVFKGTCEMEVENDGIVFHEDTVTATGLTKVRITKVFGPCSMAVSASYGSSFK